MMGTEEEEVAVCSKCKKGFVPYESAIFTKEGGLFHERCYNQEAAKGGETSKLHFDNKPDVLDKPPADASKRNSKRKSLLNNKGDDDK
jgi:hypothetical protein